MAGDALSERSRLSAAGSGTRPTESALGRSGMSDRPLPGDTRELVPAVGTLGGNTEALLIQALQENQLLKMRIEQMESQSSWHSGRTPTTPVNEGNMPQGSPVSLVHQHVTAQIADLGMGQQLAQAPLVGDDRTGPCQGSREQLVGQRVVQHPSNACHASSSVVQFIEPPAQVRVPNQGQRVQVLW